MRSSDVLVGLSVLVSCNGTPDRSSPVTQAPSALPSVLTTTRQPASFILRIAAAQDDTVVTITSATHPDLVLQTVKVGDREQAFGKLLRTYGNVRLDLAADRDIPHLAMITLMEDLRRTGFTHLEFAVRKP